MKFAEGKQVGHYGTMINLNTPFPTRSMQNVWGNCYSARDVAIIYLYTNYICFK